MVQPRRAVEQAQPFRWIDRDAPAVIAPAGRAKGVRPGVPPRDGPSGDRLEDEDARAAARRRQELLQEMLTGVLLELVDREGRQNAAALARQDRLREIAAGILRLLFHQQPPHRILLQLETYSGFHSAISKCLPSPLFRAGAY